MEPTKDLFGGVTEPRNEDDWLSLDFRAASIFSPHKPIDEEDLFAGRMSIVSRLIDVIFQDGEHAILHGGRGVGKSSLANVVKEKVLAKHRFFHVIKRNCTTGHNFSLIWQHVFDELIFDGQDARDWIAENHNPYDIFRVIDSFKANQRLVIIIDEFDRIKDDNTKVMMADTIKYLSDYGSDATLIIVGVSQSIADLFHGHASIARNIDQISMPRMKASELEQILETRFGLLHMTADKSVLNAIVSLSQGLPGYTHLMGQAAARSSIFRQSMHIDSESLSNAVETTVGKTDESITTAYLTAIRSSKPSNLYREVLLACALAESDERGYFTARAIRDPYSQIIGRDVSIPDYSRHLGEFTKSSKGPALIKVGKTRSFEYRFAEPLLRPYVIVRGVRDRLIDYNVILN